MNHEDALRAIASLEKLGVEIFLPDTNLLQHALIWAKQLDQIVAYDAQYLALAEHTGANFYTADRKLYHRCQEIGASFVHLLGEGLPT